MREDIDEKVDPMLEALVARSKKYLQHVVMENVGSPSGFTVVVNPMYGLPSEYPPSQVDVPTQPLFVHIPISNEVAIMPENPIVHMDP